MDAMEIKEEKERIARDNSVAIAYHIFEAMRPWYLESMKLLDSMKNAKLGNMGCGEQDYAGDMIADESNYKETLQAILMKLMDDNNKEKLGEFLYSLIKGE